MKKAISFGAIAAGLLLAACSSAELIEPKDNGVSEIDQTFYISMSIAGDSDSRAAKDDGNPVDDGSGTDFEVGTDHAGPESQIESAYFVFYDASGAPVGEIARVRPENGGQVETGGSIERSYSAVVPVKLHKGENMPTHVIAYINPISPASLQNPLSQVQLQTRQNVKYNANGTSYFPMSNSVHYHGTGEDSYPTMAVEIPTPTESNKIFFKNREDAEKALEANTADVITINVERYAAKLKFELAKKEGTEEFNIEDFVTTSETYESSMGAKEEPLKFKLRFHPKNWILNAECKDIYVVKSLRQNSLSGAILGNNYSFGLLNRRINVTDPNGDVTDPVAVPSGGWNWNSAEYHRCYWACSPAYFTNTYPEVADDYTEIALTHPQKFYTYAEIVGTNGAGYEMTENLHYAKETTVGYTALKSPNPAASIASVVIAGHYDVIKVNPDNTETTISKNDPTAFDDTFYTYLITKEGVPGIYFNHFTSGSKIGQCMVDGAESLLSRMASQATILYKKNGNTYTRLDYANASDYQTLSNALEIIRPMDVNIIKGLKIPSRYVTLQFKTGMNTAGSGIYLANGKGFRQIVSDDEYEHLDETGKQNHISWTEANIHLMQQVGYANKYQNSYAYFSIPVKHLGWYRTANSQKNENTINWNIVRVGDFGIVRNHSYNIKVTKISGIGTGIGNPDDPIIPPTDTQDYYVAYRMNILKWAIVPQQSVEL